MAEGLLPGSPLEGAGRAGSPLVGRSSHLSGRPKGCGPLGGTGGGLPPGCEGWRMHSRSRRTPGRRAAAVRPAISGRNAPARSLRLVLSPKRNCCLVGCEGRREGERAGGRAGEGGGLGEGATGRGQLRKAGSQASQAGSDWTGLWALFFFFSLKTHARTYTRAHTHTHSFPPSLSRFPSAAVLSLLALFPPESARGASARTALGRGSRREGPAARPKIRLQPRPEWPGPRPSGWAPGPVWGHRPAVLRLCPPTPALQTPSPLPDPARDRPKLGRGLGSGVHPGQGLERSRDCGQNGWEGETVLLLPPWGIWVQGRGP